MSAMQSELKLYGVMRQLLHNMIDTIDEDSFYKRLGQGANSPGWILGHLVVGNRFGHVLLGGPEVPAQDLARFGPGSSADLEAADCPSKAELLVAEKATAAALVNAVESADANCLDVPQQSPFLQKEFPLVRDLLGHILVSHLAMHVGQLSAWRRANGLPSILKI